MVIFCRASSPMKFDVERSMSNVRRRTFDVERSTSNVRGKIKKTFRHRGQEVVMGRVGVYTGKYFLQIGTRQSTTSPLIYLLLLLSLPLFVPPTNLARSKSRRGFFGGVSRREAAGEFLGVFSGAKRRETLSGVFPSTKRRGISKECFTAIVFCMAPFTINKLL